MKGINLTLGRRELLSRYADISLCEINQACFPEVIRDVWKEVDTVVFIDNGTGRWLKNKYKSFRDSDVF